jgi:hypothetical protein
MPSAAHLLKALRQSARPKLSIRRAAEILDMGHSSYAFYENPNLFKKPYLPLELTRRIAVAFADYSVDPAEVMKLAGLNEAEAEPEARAVEAARPAVQYVALQVALPSEPALREMFAKLLVLVPDGASRDETAEILARWLPSGFAGIGPYLPDPGAASSSSSAVLPQAPATVDPESPRP